jgi:hypothetical protein
MPLLGGRSWDDWIARYGRSHEHPVNRLCHTIGIPLIAVSILIFLAASFVPGLWEGCARSLRRRVGLSVRRARGRGQAAGVPPRLALSAGRAALVVRQAARPGLT